MQNILFTSVLGPYGVDSHRTRFKNPMSLLANQVTRGQEYYTVQMCSRTWAFDLLGANLRANVAVLDFPEAPQLGGVLRAGRWHRVGIGSIAANIESLLATYALIRKELPHVPIDVGGHATNDEAVVREIATRMRRLHPDETFAYWQPGSGPGHEVFPGAPAAELGGGVTFVKRDGLEYYAGLRGVGLRDPDAIFAPMVDASFGKRVMGIPLPGTGAGLLIPDVGCPMRCDFCSTSHKFDGRFVQFLTSAEDIMAVANAHGDRGKTEMFVMSENFSLDTRRARELLRLMEEQKRPHRFYVFSSANGLAKLGIETIVKLGYSFVWLGLEESSGEVYKKARGVDLRALVTQLQAHGVEVLGSTILGFEHHTAASIPAEVEHALGYGCVYNQFMLYMPVPGTALWDRMRDGGRLKSDFPWPDSHGQARQNWHHPNLGEDELESMLDAAFTRDYEVLGPSLFRMMRVHWSGYVTTRDWAHELVQMRRAEMKKIFVTYVPLLSAMGADLGRQKHRLTGEVLALRDAMVAETGWQGRLALAAGGPIARAALELEKFRHRRRQRDRRSEVPRCQLTHYGSFGHRYPWYVPTPWSPPAPVRIPHAARARGHQKIASTPNPPNAARLPVMNNASS